MPSDVSPNRAMSSAAGVSRSVMALVLICAASVAYHNSLGGPFVFDDQGAIVDNPSIRHVWPPTFWFAAPVDAGVAGRPFANLTFALNYATGGLGVRGFHLMNAALHTLAAAVLFGVVRRTLRLPVLEKRFGAQRSLLALAVAGLWLLHPLATAAVGYISQRTEVLAALCQLLTLYGFVRSIEPGARRAWVGFAIAACTLGMAAKETMVTAPVLVFLYDCALVAGGWREAWRERRGFHLALAATWLVLAALMATSQPDARGIGFRLGVSWFDYALTAGGAQIRYLALAIWPAPLVFDYGWAYSRFTPASAAALTGLMVLVCSVSLGLVRRRAWALAGAWFFLLVAPSSTVVPIVEQPIAESRAYLPMAGVVALVVLGGYVALGRRVWIVTAGVAVLFCALTARRNADYADAIGLWTDTLAKQPQSARAHGNLAAELLHAGRLEEALQHALEAARLRPTYADAYTNAGGALVRAGRAAEAIPHLETALHLRPKLAASHYNLANAQLRAGRVEEGVARLEEALRYDPKHVLTHNDLGVGLQLLGRTTEAIAHGQTAVQLAPRSADARYNLANALAAAGRTAEAIVELETALRLQPGFAKAHNNLGVVLLRARRTAEAIAQFEAALRLRPDYTEARRNLEAAQRAGATP